MKKSFKQIIFSLCLGLFALTQAGCFWLAVGAAAGAGGYAWVQGGLEQNLNASAEKVHDAVAHSLNKLGLSIIEDHHDKLKGKVVAEFSDGQNVTVEVNALTERTTKLKIRVGVLGDKAKSEMILNEVKKNL